jgi:dTDP-4-amino-4,6-dideoxygalactose transaminase
MIRFNKPTIDRKDLESVLYCMITDDLAPGDYMKEFGSLLGKMLGLGTAIVFNSYLQSFQAAFSMIGASSGDEVILSSFTRFRIYNALRVYGLKPVLVDLDEASLLPSPGRIKETITEKTRCIIIQQLFGIPNDLATYMELGVPVIEDLDGALCSSTNGKALGGFGTLVTMNFSDDAVITTGNGGMLASNDRRLKAVYREYYEQSADFDHLMSDFNASLGISQIKKMDRNCSRRKSIGQYYDNAVMGSGCSLVGREDGQELAYSSYPVYTETPFEDCVRFFKRYGIPVRRGVEQPLHRHMGLDVEEFENTEEMFNRIITLPIYPTLAREAMENVARGIRAIL